MLQPDRFVAQPQPENERRHPQQTLQMQAWGLLNRMEKNGVTIHDLGKPHRIRLRARDQLEKLIPALRETKMGFIKLVEKQMGIECLDSLGQQYESLPEEKRTFNGVVRPWNEVLQAIPDIADFLIGLQSLTDPEVYFINEKGQLVIGDGCEETPLKTRNVNYPQSRYRETRVSYLPAGEKPSKFCGTFGGNPIVVLGDDTSIPAGALILSERGLITLEEYQKRDSSDFDDKALTWVESGKNSRVARIMWKHNRSDMPLEYFDHDHPMHRSGMDLRKHLPFHNPDQRSAVVGARCVLRVNLFGNEFPIAESMPECSVVPTLPANIVSVREAALSTMPKRGRGRPSGSRNKPKVQSV